MNNCKKVHVASEVLERVSAHEIFFEENGTKQYTRVSKFSIEGLAVLTRSLVTLRTSKNDGLADLTSYADAFGLYMRGMKIEELIKYETLM